MSVGLLSTAVLLSPTNVHAIEHVPPEYDAKIFHVSPSDSDPVAKATRLVREWKSSHGGELPRGGVIVEFADGTYPLKETWTLDAADSGSPECPILFRAAHPGKVIFSGAASLDWRLVKDESNLPPSAALIPDKVRDRVLTAVVPGEGAAPSFYGASRYMQDELLERPEYVYPWALYEDGVRMENARWPNAGEAKAVELTGNIKTAWVFKYSSAVTFRAQAPSGEAPRLALWKGEPDLYLHGVWRLGYVDSTTRPVALDPEKGMITLDRRDAQHGMSMNAPFIAINAISELDRPGEWALDLKARRLYALPLRVGARPLLAKTKTLLRLKNVTDVEFEGFVFEAVRGDAVQLTNCRDIDLRTSIVRGTTGWGVRIEGGRNCRVEGCDLYDLGEGGVWLEGGNRDTLTHSGHVCDNCHIRDYAKLVWNYNPGVSLLGCGSTATHNLIHHAPHQACFYYGAEHRFAWNVVHDVCRFSNDAGAIYSYNTHDAWSHRGNVIEYNVVHSVKPREPHYCELNGIYIDALTSGTIVRGNIVSETTIGIFSSGGQDNTIERNIVLHSRLQPIRRWNLGLMGPKRRKNHHVIWGKTNDCDRASYLMKPLIDKHELYQMSFWKDRYPNHLKPLDFEDPGLAHCSHFCHIRNNITAGSSSILILDADTTAETTTVADNAEYVGDPGFIDYAGFNWELRADSPARQVLGGGTRFHEMGLYADSRRISPAVKFGDGVTKPQVFNPHASAAILKGVDYSKTVRSRLWLWGADANIARELGIPNLCVSDWPDLPKGPISEVYEHHSELDGFGWSAGDDGNTHTFTQKLDRTDALANMHPNLKAVWLDNGVDSPGIRRPASELVDLKARLEPLGAKAPRLTVDCYSSDLNVDAKPVFEIADQISFWIRPADIPNLNARLDRCRELVGSNKPILLGLYLWDFAAARPVSAEQVRRQLKEAEQLLRAAKIEGIIFRCSSDRAAQAKAFSVAKEWIQLHGEEIAFTSSPHPTPPNLRCRVDAFEIGGHLPNA